MNKQKICPTCNKSFTINQTQFRKIFCSLKCTQDMAKMQKLQMEVLNREKEYVELETEVLYAKKQNLILKESVNFDVPFIRIQEERYSKKVDKNEGIVLPEDSDVIEVN